MQPGRDEAARLLNIIPYALPDGADVSPIAAYLGDDTLRMNARDALQLAGTTESRRALRTALIHARGTFALALIDALRLLQDSTALDVLASRLQDEDPAIRMAAARALAWTGDAAFIPAFRQVIRGAPRDRVVEAGDAYLTLIGAMYENGGQFDGVFQSYVWGVRQFENPELRGAALASLGRCGDERAVPLIIEVLRRERAGALDHAALEALAMLPGETATRAIVTRHAELLKTLGPSLYGVYGRRGDAVFTPLLLDALESSDPYAQHVAAQALLDAKHPDGVAAVAP